MGKRTLARSRAAATPERRVLRCHRYHGGAERWARRRSLSL